MQALEAYLVEDRVELINGWCYGAQRPLVQHEATLRQSPHSTALGTQAGQTVSRTSLLSLMHFYVPFLGMTTPMHKHA